VYNVSLLADVSLLAVYIFAQVSPNNTYGT